MTTFIWPGVAITNRRIVSLNDDPDGGLPTVIKEASRADPKSSCRRAVCFMLPADRLMVGFGVGHVKLGQEFGRN
ncbi:MAG: hypothetical protein IPM39_27090 [Chloroflexi bacterium]|nr:hypothetical protein [Chloroflexota bacterium]